ncbi:unnamed protein product [Dovyalis caffra]|uniref:Peptidase metallopeptidase domain-containing protein n=1 Tax=Dovyalis caffra TaxID=77055 RepID=A0AAV1RZ59_9ROSI|nr:unnamed protein product [Dovyalis caffra]
MATKVSHFYVSILLLVLVHSFIAQSRTLKSSNTLEFLQNLEGSQKGQNVKGLKELKHHLKKLGYYPKDLQHDTDLSDDFDELFESAIKTYQKNYRLKVTGSLDSDTIKEIMIPRCGVPDPINHDPSKRTGRTEHGNKSSKFHAVSHYSFFGGTPKWPASKFHLTYTFSSSVQVTIDMQELRSACSRAFQKWADVTQFTFQEVSEGSPADIVIGFQRGDHGDGDPFDGPGNILAHAFSPTDGRLHYDADEKWSTNPSTDESDLESVAVHEIGHLLGLGHSMDQNSIMFAEIPAGAIKRDLNQDDIDGIRTLYSN